MKNKETSEKLNLTEIASTTRFTNDLDLIVSDT